MTQLPKNYEPRRGIIFPDSKTTPETLAKRQAKRDELGQRCRLIFEEIRPQLIEQYYNWFIAIDPDSGNYLIDPKLEGLIKKVRRQYPDGEMKMTAFRINENGSCGKIRSGQVW